MKVRTRLHQPPNKTSKLDSAAIFALIRARVPNASSAALRRAPLHSPATQVARILHDAIEHSPGPPRSAKWFEAAVQNHYRELPFRPPFAAMPADQLVELVSEADLLEGPAQARALLSPGFHA